MPICKGARTKIKRADKHISELEACIDGLRKRLIATAHVDTNSGLEYIECGFTGVEESEVLEDLSAIIGDVVHNLKCALDYAWFETVNRLIPSGKWKTVNFPVFPSRDELERKLRNLQIDTSTPNFCRFLVGQVKPYDTGDWAIRTVHKLDRRDKHRLLIPALHYSSISGIKLEDPDGVIHERGTWAATQFPYYVNLAGDLHIKDPGRPALTVMFQHGDAATGLPATDVLRYYSAHFFMVVKLFEQFVES